MIFDVMMMMMMMILLFLPGSRSSGFRGFRCSHARAPRAVALVGQVPMYVSDAWSQIKEHTLCNDASDASLALCIFLHFLYANGWFIFV